MSIDSPLLENDHISTEAGTEAGTEAVEEGESQSTTSEVKSISDVKEAKGYIMIYAGRGIKVINHIFFLSALISLAIEDAGCDNDDDDEECDNKVYGLKPSSIAPVLHVLSAIIAIFLMPVFGAMIDFTSHRRSVGICTAYAVIIISFILIGTTKDTWFFMMIVFAIYNLAEDVQSLAIFSYLPDVGTKLDEGTMTYFSSRCSMSQYAVMISYIILITGIGIIAGLGDAGLSRVACGVGGVMMMFFFYSWYSMPIVPQLHSIPPGQNLLVAGFYQNWRTFKGIFNQYRYGLNLFLIANAFATPAAKMVLGVIIIVIKEDLDMKGSEIGIFFLITLLFSIPGAKMVSHVTQKLKNPVRSMQIVIVMYIIDATVTVLIVDKPERKPITYICAMVLGFLIGWFYPTTNLIFSLAIPKGQESELTGFYIYSSTILDWVPPLIFTGINEAGLGKKAGMIGVVSFFFPALIALQCMIPWEEVRLSAKDRSKMIPVFEDE